MSPEPVLALRRAVEAVETDVAGAGFGSYVAGAGLLELDVAGAGAEGSGTLDAVGADRAGAALGFESGSDVLNVERRRSRWWR